MIVVKPVVDGVNVCLKASDVVVIANGFQRTIIIFKGFDQFD